MRLLDLNVKLYAETMTEALALMYWCAKINANDVEFVLDPPRAELAPASTVLGLTVCGFSTSIAVARCRWTKQASSKLLRRSTEMIPTIRGRELDRP